MLPEEKIETSTTENGAPPEERTWVEEIEVTSNQLVDRVKELVAEGNVRHLIIRTPDERVIIEVPLTAGVAVGSVVTIFAPVLAALGALAALIARVKIEITRTEHDNDSTDE
jgi:hypothetical protein